MPHHSFRAAFLEMWRTVVDLCAPWIMPFCAGLIIRGMVWLRRPIVPPFRRWVADMFFGGVAAVLGFLAAMEIAPGSMFIQTMLTVSSAVLGYSLVVDLTVVVSDKLQKFLRLAGEPNANPADRSPSGRSADGD